MREFNSSHEDLSTRLYPSDPFAQRPANRPGLTTCNTRCMKAACRRTYDDGKKVPLQAKHVFHPFTSEWIFGPVYC